MLFIMSLIQLLQNMYWKIIYLTQNHYLNYLIINVKKMFNIFKLLYECQIKKKKIILDL